MTPPKIFTPLLAVCQILNFRWIWHNTNITQIRKRWLFFPAKSSGALLSESSLSEKGGKIPHSISILANSGHCESWHYPRAPVKCVGGQLLWWWSIWRELPWPSQGSDWESEKGRETERAREREREGRWCEGWERQWKMDFHTFIIAVTPYVLRSNFTFENGAAAQIKNDINFCQPAHIAFFIPGETLLD